MELSEVQQLVAWLKASGMSRLELSRAGERLSLKVAGRDQLQLANREDAPLSSTLAAASGHPVARAESAGIFLAAHPMHDAPLVKLGDTVRKDDVVGLLKTGLVYAPVTAPADGVVSKIFAIDGEMVGFGSPVLELNPVVAG